MVKPISAVSPTFQGIYKKDTYYTDEQKQIMEKLKVRLRSDEYKNNKGETLEQQYEKSNIAFLLGPSPKGNDKIEVEFMFNPRFEDDGMACDSVPYSSRLVGHFNNDNEDLLIMALERKEKEAKYSNRLSATIIFAGIAFIGSLLFGTIKDCSNRAKEQIPKTVQVAADTTKTIVNIIKNNR